MYKMSLHENVKIFQLRVDQDEEDNGPLAFLVKSNTLKNSSKVYERRHVFSVSRRLFEGDQQACKEQQQLVLNILDAEACEEVPFWLYPEESEGCKSLQRPLPQRRAVANFQVSRPIPVS